MKKKIRILITILLPVYISVAGCTMKSVEGDRDRKEEESVNVEKGVNHEVYLETEIDEPEKVQSKQKAVDKVLNRDDMIYKDIVLMRQAKRHKVCIAVEPSVLRTYSCYYYIPDDKDQEWLQQYLETMPIEGKTCDEKWTGIKEKGWQIAYKDKCFMVFEGGYLKDSYLDESGKVIEYLVEAPKLCDYIQIMLQERLGYVQFHPADIKNIISAKLDVHSTSTNKEFYTQTITDEETLKLFEDWFSHAEYIYGGAECGNQDACLELVMANGEVVSLSVATDSCPNFGINGLYYDYRPESVWDNREFFEQFDEIPWDWDIGT